MPRLMLESLIWFATGKRVLVSLITLLIGGAALFMLGPYPNIVRLNGNRALPEEQFSTPDSTAEFLVRIGPQGRELYAYFQLSDLLNPMLICTFLILLVAWLIRLSGRSKQLKMLTIVPLLVLIAELWENSLLYLAATGFPSAPIGFETLQFAITLKFGGLGLSVLAALGLAGIVIIRKVRPNADVT